MLTIVKADGKSEKELLKAFESRSGEVDRTVCGEMKRWTNIPFNLTVRFQSPLKSQGPP